MVLTGDDRDLCTSREARSIVGFCGIRGIVLCKEVLELVEESVHVLELSVDRSKSDVRNLVKLLELVHDKIADEGTGNFLGIERKDLSLDAVDHVRDLLKGDRTLTDSKHDASLDLGSVVGFTGVILLDDEHRDGLYFLVCSESLVANVALSPASDGTPVVRRSRIDDSRVFISAKRTLHTSYYPLKD